MQTNFFEHKGRHYLRVSTILANLQDNYRYIPQEVLNAKALIGTEVHKLCQQFLMGETVDDSNDQRVLGYFDSFKKFCKNGIFQKPLVCEQRFFDDELGITGQIDMICPTKGNPMPVLVDLKTTASANEPIWLIQGALYAKMVAETNPELNLADVFVFLQLKEKGNAKVYRFTNWREKLPTITSIVRQFIDSNKMKLQEMLENELKVQ